MKSKTTEYNVSLSGASLYLQHCAICHGENGKLGASGAKDLTISTLDSAEIVQLIKNGKNAMPKMKDLLETEENIGLVTTHVLKFKK